MKDVMKKALFLAGLGLCAGFYSRPAAAAYVTGDDLVKSCRSDKPAEVFSCMNYIAGVIDYHVMMQSLGTAPTLSFCLPENLPLEKAAVVVMLYLKKSPQNGSFIAAPAVTMALNEAYPCGPEVSAKKKK
jgi:hypothetical protein